LSVTIKIEERRVSFIKNKREVDASSKSKWDVSVILLKTRGV